MIAVVLVLVSVFSVFILPERLRSSLVPSPEDQYQRGYEYARTSTEHISTMVADMQNSRAFDSEDDFERGMEAYLKTHRSAEYEHAVLEHYGEA